MLAVIGEALIDLVDTAESVESVESVGRGATGRSSERTFRALPGGSPLNVAVGAARLGEPTAFLARLADDAFGRQLRAHAERNGVDLSAAVRADQPTTLAVVSVGADGAASYDFYVEGTADWQWCPDELTLPPHAAVVHFGSLASWLGPGDAVIRAAVAEADALISYDPNVRPRLLGSAERARGIVEANVAAADVVKASDEDVGWLYPGRQPDAVAAEWLALGPALVVVTAGARGATAYRAGREPVHRPARPVEVVDTVGAGDSWTGGLLAALHRDGVVSAGAVRDLPEGRLAELVDEALLVAALTCGRAGADPPTRAELRAAQ